MSDFEWTRVLEDRLIGLRIKGDSYPDIAEDLGCSAAAARSKYRRMTGTHKSGAGSEALDAGPGGAGAGAEKETDSVLLTRDDISRILSLDDLLAFFKVDEAAWAVRDFRVNKWENYSVENGVTPLYQVRANLIRNVQRDAEIARQAYAQVVRDMQECSPVYPEPEPWDMYDAMGGTVDPVLLEIAPMDAHLGMLAWGRECGEPWDLDAAVEAYVETTMKALTAARFYDVERILFVVGNDLIHADTLQGGKVATTTAGTAQDMDTRLPKIFTAARRAVVQCIDAAREIAHVDVLVVAGNHDQQTSYRLGEVLNAWYRLDDRVDVLYSPAKRQGYQYGKNGFLFTHGEEFKRKREPLALIFADEFPDLWAQSEYREVHCGHFHSTQSMRYNPDPELTETRGVRLRVLPALTPADAWHVESGFRHHRAVTALAFHREGGLAGLHEFTPERG